MDRARLERRKFVVGPVGIDFVREVAKKLVFVAFRRERRGRSETNAKALPHHMRSAFHKS
jgi:hypothetical protein